MTLSNPPTLGLTAQAPITVTPSHPAKPSYIPRAGFIELVIDGLARLALTISQDWDVYVYSKDILLDSHVVGEGLVDQADMDEEARADVEVEPSLFVGGGNTRNAMINGDDDYINLHNPAEDEMDIDEDDDEKAGCEEIIQWLNSLGPQIVSYFLMDAVYSFLFILRNWCSIRKKLNHTGTPTPCPHLAIEPKSYQDTALGKIEYLDKSPSRAIILGDPPGLGKTLPAMMAIVKAIATAKRFSIVVVPSSCVDQWKSEFAKFFLPIYSFHDFYY
jgi:SNF2 family DNA or RNA helicase